MKLSRRDILKSSLLVPAAATAAHGISLSGSSLARSASLPGNDPGFDPEASSPLPGAGRERLLLDFGWRFHFGDANFCAALVRS